MLGLYSKDSTGNNEVIEASAVARPIEGEQGPLQHKALGMIRRMKGDLVRYDKVKISDWDALEAGTRLKYLEEVWKQVNKEYDRFCGSSEDSIGNECSVAFSELVEEYLPLKSAMQARIGNVLSTESTDQTQIIQVGDQRIQIQLSEPAKVPKFTGKEVEWAKFKALFETEVHNNTKYSASQKMHYLVGAALYGNRPYTAEDSYAALWKQMCDRYGNEYITVQVHLQALFGMSPLRGASSEGLGG